MFSSMSANLTIQSSLLLRLLSRNVLQRAFLYLRVQLCSCLRVTGVSRSGLWDWDGFETVDVLVGCYWYGDVCVAALSGVW